jgi:hypothetical protein
MVLLAFLDLNSGPHPCRETPCHFSNPLSLTALFALLIFLIGFRFCLNPQTDSPIYASHIAEIRHAHHCAQLIG